MGGLQRPDAVRVTNNLGFVGMVVAVTLGVAFGILAAGFLLAVIGLV